MHDARNERLSLHRLYAVAKKSGVTVGQINDERIMFGMLSIISSETEMQSMNSTAIRLEDTLNRC